MLFIEWTDSLNMITIPSMSKAGEVFNLKIFPYLRLGIFTSFLANKGKALQECVDEARPVVRSSIYKLKLSQHCMFPILQACEARIVSENYISSLC